MMWRFPLPSRLYGFFASRRPLLYSATLAVVLAGAAAFLGTDISEDLGAMLPENPPHVREAFGLLQEAPFSRNVMVTLTREPEVPLPELIRTADRLSAAMGPPFFGRVVSGPPEQAGTGLAAGLFRALPNLFTEEDRKTVEAQLSPEAVRGQLQRLRERLRSPEAWGMKELMREDPLDLHVLALQKLAVANAIPNVRIQDGRFVSPDTRSLLLIADSTVDSTDARGSRELLDRFKTLVKDTLPGGIRATLVSGHPYAAANAETVKADLVRVLVCSSVLILAVFVLLLRSWRAIFVFLLPGSALCLAVLGVRLFHDQVSGITLGFGAVLLGITVDYAVHVYFGLRNGSRPPGRILEEIGRPMVFSGLTTMAAFGVLLLSDLPGQRQLALFSLCGIGAAMVFSLVTLPHLIPPAPGRIGTWIPSAAAFTPATRRRIRLVWLGLLILGAWQAFHVRIDGDLRSAGMVTPEIRAAEQELAAVWGPIRGRAIAFVRDPDLEKALETNDRLFARLAERGIPSVTSLSPVLPSQSVQKANRERWAAFWERRATEALTLIGEEGRGLGFSSLAFDPFAGMLGRPPAPVVPEDLRRWGVGDLLDTLLVRTPQGVHQVLTLADGPVDRLAQAAGDGEGGLLVNWVSESGFGEAIGGALKTDFIQFLLRAATVVAFLLLLLYRRPLRAARALLPVVTGLVVMFGVMGAAGIPFNLFNIIAAILVIGLGVDYGIFMEASLSGEYQHATEQALVVSGLTTMAGLGSLVLARHPALHSIGVTVVLGVGAAIPAALLVMPAVYPGRRRKGG